jgi:hypothetical protein
MHRNERVGPLLPLDIYDSAAAVVEWSASLSEWAVSAPEQAPPTCRVQRTQSSHELRFYTSEEDISDDRLPPIAYRHPLRR